MSLPIRLLWWLFASACTAASAAEEPARWVGLSDVLFRHHPQTATGTAFAQDRSGFVWVGSQSGLSRWDGYRFRRYVANPDVAGSLPDSFISSLQVDERGRLWVGTNTGGLARYDASSDTFVTLRAGAGGLSAASVLALVGDGAGGVWVGTGTGLDHIDAAGAVLGAPPGQGLPEGGVQALLNDRSGTLWVGTRHGLLRREVGQSAFSVVPLGADDEPALSVAALCEDDSGRLWVGTRAHGAFVIEARGARPRAVRESGPVAALEQESVLAIVEALPGRVWLGTDVGGIVEVAADGGSTRRVRHHAGIATSLEDDDIQALFRDRSGLVWVASVVSISQHDPEDTGVLSLLGASGRRNGISHASVPFVLPVPEGRVWLSLGDGGVDIVDPLLGRVRTLLPDPGHPETALPRARVLTMAIGSGGEIYLGTNRGLYRSDAAGLNVRRLAIAGRSPTAPVWALCVDAGTLWLGGLDGLWALDVPTSGAPRLLRHEAAAALGDARVTTLVRGPDAKLWVGTQAGLARVDTVSGAVERVPGDAADPTRLAPGYVSSVLVDARGRVWVAIYGSGVNLLERQDADGRLWFRRLGPREGLPDAGANALLEDALGAIWVSTDDGLAVIEPTRLAIRSLQRPQGLIVLSYWTNAAAVAATGELLFGGVGGLTVVRPERLTGPAPASKVVVTEIRVGTVTLPAGRFNEPALHADPLELGPADRSLAVEFAALDLSAPERNRYAYRLEGFDDDWIASDSMRRLASYTNLPPGDYALLLRGSNRDGIWAEPLRLPLRVLPAWYQTAWFRVLAGAVVLGLVVALVQTRTAYLRQRQRELEALVDERTAELRQRSAALHESQRRLETIAYVDPLTDLANRRLFNEDVGKRVALALRYGSAFSLLLIDLDRFKEINDTRGHDAGDALLRAVAVRLLAAVRQADRVARMGGDEFAVLLTESSAPEDNDLLCRRILASLAEPVPFGDGSLRVTASIGVAMCPKQAVTPDALYKAADVALYEAKRGGRDTWRLFE